MCKNSILKKHFTNFSLRNSNKLQVNWTNGKEKYTL